MAKNHHKEGKGPPGGEKYKEKKGSQHRNFEGEIFHEGQASALALPPP